MKRPARAQRQGIVVRIRAVHPEAQAFGPKMLGPSITRPRSGLETRATLTPSNKHARPWAVPPIPLTRLGCLGGRIALFSGMQSNPLIWCKIVISCYVMACLLSRIITIVGYQYKQQCHIVDILLDDPEIEPGGLFAKHGETGADEHEGRRRPSWGESRRRSFVSTRAYARDRGLTETFREIEPLLTCWWLLLHARGRTKAISGKTYTSLLVFSPAFGVAPPVT